MVDTTDLKSVDLISREGSSPSTPIFDAKVFISNFLIYNLLILVIVLYKSYFYYKNLFFKKKLCHTV